MKKAVKKTQPKTNKPPKGHVLTKEEFFKVLDRVIRPLKGQGGQPLQPGKPKPPKKGTSKTSG